VEVSATGSELPALKGEVRVVEPGRGQRTIARRAAETRATVPDLELRRDVDIEAALALVDERGGSLTAVLVRACALALRDCPEANGAYRDGHYELYSRVNVGVTLHREGSYISPTVLDADTKALDQLHQEIEDLRTRAASGELTPPQLAGATFTLIDLSSYRVDAWSPVITPPQAAALTAGGVRTAPVVRDGAVVPGRLLGLTLACDHRILFGAQAAAFLEAVSTRVERPEP
jgi:pyruvate dehydrogenase E2 component (dihydrolipoyllysine-residue acetyltransferase)